MSKVVKGIALAGAIFLTGGAAIYLAPGLLATAAVGSFITSMAVGAFLSGVSAQLSGTKRGARPTVDRRYAGTVEPRRILYGQIQCSGMMCLPPVTSGTNNKDAHGVLALAGHRVYSVGAVYFDQTAVGTIGSITGASTDGLVSTGTYANKAWVRRYDGSQTTADYILDNALSIWTSSHIGYDVAYLAYKLELDPAVYKTGEPNVTVIVQGKICYDPRLDSSPGANPTNPSYAAYTTNPALCLADYITDDDLGMGEETSRIDWDMVADAADICDELVAIPVASTQKRYTCNLPLLATTDYEDNIKTIAACMLGSCLYSGGKWRMRAGAWETPSFEITDSQVMGALQIATAYPYKERYNGVRGVYIDATNNYQPNEFPAVQNATYVTDDGESVFRDVQFAGCTNVYEAQRNAIYLTRKSRNPESFVVPCDMSLWPVRPGATGIATITEMSYSSKTIRCEGWKFTPDGLVGLTQREELSSDWNDPIEADYTTPLAISNVTPVYYTPAAPSALTASGTAYGIIFNWTAPALVPVGSEYELWEYTSSTPFASATRIWRGRGTTASIDKSDLTTRYYWVRLVMPDGTAGSEYPTSAAGVAGTPGTVTEMQRVTASATTITGTSGSQQILASVTAPSRPVAYTFVVSAIFGANVTADTLGGGAIYVYIKDSTRSVFAVAEAVVYAAALSSTAGNNVMIEDSFSIPASTAVTYNLYAFTAASTAAEVSSIVLKAEAIKL